MKDTKLKQIMKNLDQFRGEGKVKKVVVTDEQKEFLIACRDNVSPVSWNQIAELWKEIGWGNISEAAIRTRYKVAKAK